MAEAVVEQTEKPLEQMTVKELREKCREKGIKYSEMNKAQMQAAIQATDAVVAVETVREAVGEPMAVAVGQQTEIAAEPEKPKSPWDGFLPELFSVCTALEEVESGNFLPGDLLEVVTIARDSTTVEEFDRFSEDELAGMINTLRTQLPRYQREVHETIGLLATARPMVIDVDFI